VAPIFERRAAGVYHNSALMIDADGRLAGLYRKMHIPDDPLFYEKFYFTPGDLGFRAFDLGPGRVGTLICWDQ
jgi:N-carbamoylputrescine amidase